MITISDKELKDILDGASTMGNYPIAYNMAMELCQTRKQVQYLLEQIADKNKYLSEIELELKEFDDNFKWYSVNDQLPKSGISVIALNFGIPVVSYMTNDNEWHELYYDERINHVTYWMPIKDHTGLE